MKTKPFTSQESQKMLIFVITLIIISTALFVIGVFSERNARSVTPVLTSTDQKSTTLAQPAQDSDGGHESSSAQMTVPGVADNHTSEGTGEGNVFGFNVESLWLVGAMVAVWLLLIPALLKLGRPAWFGLLLVAIITSILDLLEIIRKISETNNSSFIFAVLVLTTHIVIIAATIMVLIGKPGHRIAQRTQPM